MKFVPFRVRSLRLSLSMVLCAAFAIAQSSATFAQVDRARSAPHDRVRGPVTNERTALKGQTHPMTRSAVDLGEVSASMSTGRMVLWLRRSSEQQAQLSQFLSRAQNPGSGNYRQWMTPESYGAAYGISDNDLAAVQQWLQASGLKVEKVSSARNAIMFSGTAGSLAMAFHTSIHSYSVGQQKHFSNANDPEIPAALAPVIAGVSPMNDFHPKPMHVLASPARYDAASARLHPEITIPQANGNALFVTPADASIIYDTPNKNFNPAATQTLDGTGVTIGILGYSALAMADVQNYRTAFLPASSASNMPQQILDGGVDPGIIYGDSAIEALLDVEIAGGLAPGAAIRYYYAASDDLSDGLILAGLHALEENKVNILSASYGSCERDLGPGGNLAWFELWQQAAAQGITVTVSTGDTGSATCDGDTPDKPALATMGLSVNGLASTPYNIAVGGTDFYQLPNSFSTYVNPAATGQYPYYASALSYIPENPWNDSSSVAGYAIAQNEPVGMGINFTNIIAAGGGLSSVAACPGTLDDQGNCSASLTGYAQPPFQLGAGGAFQQTGVRSIPDVSLLSANGVNGATWAFCDDSVTDGIGGNATHCQVDADGHLIDGQNVGGVGGTSASTPAFAGMLALISQSQGGARLGQADTVLYNLAQDYNPDPGNPGKYQRAFHDVAIGNNSVSCASGSQDCMTFAPDGCADCSPISYLSGYGAFPYYDMASGLGSVDLSQLISLWGATNFASTSNTLAGGTTNASLSTSPISVVHGTPLYFATTVTPGNATGQFSLLTTNTATAASFTDTGVLQSNGTGQLVTNDLPGGTYTAYAYYAGDTGHTGSQSSNSINITISPEPSTTQLFFGGYDPLTLLINEGVSTMPYGAGSYISAQPYGNNSTTDANGNVTADGVATGNVIFTSNGSSQSVALNSLGVAQISATSFPPGTYTYQASYPGDASFAPSKSTLQTLTITKGVTSLAVNPNAGVVSPVDPPLDLIAILQTDSIARYPTGKIIATVNGHTYAPTFNNEGQQNGANAIQFAFEIPVSDLAAGSNTVNVNYGGDANYQASGAGATITLTGVTGSFSLSGPTQPVVVEASQQGSATISVTPAGGFTGQVNMACTVSAASTGHTPICQAAAATVYGSFVATSVVSIASFSDTPAGSYTITVTGTNGQQKQSVQIPLQVTAGPGFTLAAAASSLTTSPGQSVTDVLSITPTQSFTGTVQLVCTITPTPGSGKAPACTLPASVVLGSGVSKATLQVTSDSTTPLGSYSVAVTVFSGLLEQTLTLPLSIQPPPPPPPAPSFGLSAVNSTLSVAAPGQTATDALSITPTGGFTGTVQLSCSVSSSVSNAPTCSVPATAAITGTSAATATLTVNTVGATAALKPADTPFGRGIGVIALGCVLIIAIPRRRTWTPLLLLLVTAGVLAVTGCGGSGSSSGGGSTSTAKPGTPAGSYTVMVTATSGSISTTTQIVVTVQ